LNDPTFPAESKQNQSFRIGRNGNRISVEMRNGKEKFQQSWNSTNGLSHRLRESWNQLWLNFGISFSWCFWF